MNRRNDELDIAEFIRPYFRSWWADLQKDRFRKIRGYVFDRLMFKGLILNVILITFGLGYIYHFDMDYYSCDPGTEIKWGLDGISKVDGLCENPFYRPGWKNEEFLSKGEYGLKPSKWVYQYLIFLISTISMTLLANHYYHNRKKVRG